jgi:hypothetical protein
MIVMNEQSRFIDNGARRHSEASLMIVHRYLVNLQKILFRYANMKYLSFMGGAYAKWP